MRVLLLGLMGVGKTRVGEALASQLGWPYLDNDVEVTRRVGLSKAALVEVRGEGALREVESALVLDLLAGEGPLVAGLPAGAVLDSHVQQALAARAPDVKLVWLRASTDTLVARLSVGSTGATLARPGAPRRALHDGAAARGDLPDPGRRRHRRGRRHARGTRRADRRGARLRTRFHGMKACRQWLGPTRRDPP